MKSEWKLDPATGTFVKARQPKRSLPDGTPLSRLPEYRRLFHQQKYRDDEEYQAKVQERERRRRQEHMKIPDPTRPVGPCEICGAETNGTSKTGAPIRMHVDHDHATGAFRGWLCSRCNTGIGMLRDDPALLAAAIRYLDAHAASHKRLAEEA